MTTREEIDKTIEDLRRLTSRQPAMSNCSGASHQAVDFISGVNVIGASSKYSAIEAK